MDKTQQTSTADDRPLAGSDAASAPPCSGFTLRGRPWLDDVTSPAQADRATSRGRGLIG